MLPQINSIYVISKFLIDDFGTLGLVLIGSSCVHIPSDKEVGWDSSAFRLLDELKEQSTKLNEATKHQTA